MSFLPKTVLLFLLLLTSYSAFSMDGEQPSSKAGNSTVKSQKIDQDTYFSMFKKIEQKPDQDGKLWILNERSKDLGKIFNTLNITLSQSQMVDIFNKYHVLMHRPLTHDKLVIGCGNLPPYDPTFSVYYIDYLERKYKDDPTYRVKHAHRDSDTIDPDFARDPTIVAEIGKIAPKLFQGKKYKSIVLEGILILPDELKKIGRGEKEVRESLQAAQTLYQILDDEGTLTTADNVVMSKEKLEWYVSYWSTSPELENYIAFINKILGPRNPSEPSNPSPLPVYNTFSSSEPHALSRNKTHPLSKTLEEFMETYGVTLEEILEDLKMEEDSFWQLVGMGWSRVEEDDLSPEFKERVYNKLKTKSSSLSLEDFNKVYDVTREEIIKALLSPQFKERVYNKLKTKSSSLERDKDASSPSSSETHALSESLEEFMETYGVTLEEILKDLQVEEEDFWAIANAGWSNVEAYELSPEFKERVYGKERPK